MPAIVSDTTPLNYLVLIDAVDLLPRLYQRVLIPPAVRDELTRPKTPETVRLWMIQPPSWLEVVTRGIRFMSQPMLTVQVRALRDAYRSFQSNGDIVQLLEAAIEMEIRFGTQTPDPVPVMNNGAPNLKREYLNLICFDFISG